MSTTNRFSLTLETLAHLASDKQTAQPVALPALPSLSAALSEFSPLPRASLFLGLANDGLPILLNLLDPLPGPLIIVGDHESGKTNFLRSIASSVYQARSSQDIRYFVLSDNLPEWKHVKGSRNGESVLSTHDPSIAGFFNDMVGWAHSNKGSQQTRVLLIDSLDSLLTHETQQDLRWLFLRGPARGVWPIVTIDASSAVSDSFRPWLDAFRTRLFGYIHDDHAAQCLTGLSQVSFSHLMAGHQFAMREGNDWLSFWIPTLD
jgi:hypothetical protein